MEVDRIFGNDLFDGGRASLSLYLFEFNFDPILTGELPESVVDNLPVCFYAIEFIENGKNFHGVE